VNVADAGAHGPPGGTAARPAVVVRPPALSALVKALRAAGHTVIAPVRRGGAIVLEEVADASSLPLGLRDEQLPGSYRLVPREDDAAFGYGPGPASWKGFLHPPALLRFRATREGKGFRIEPAELPDVRYAFLGVRPCDLAAIARLRRVVAAGAYPDPADAARFRDLFVVAVQCTEPGGTCFCASTGTGPAAPDGFDLALTERLGAGRHELLVEAGSEKGAGFLPPLGGRPATGDDVDEARAATAAARERMGRTLEVEGLREVLRAAADSPRWHEVAGRCLCCGSCTMVCPTCFCTTVEETTDLSGERAERWRRWDSCFSLDFSHLQGGSVRQTPSSRYRHWLTHKLGTWWDQFGESGCVGCGRCITWCPAGIDLLEEARALRTSAGAHPGGKE
jgi:sulfhydrogenase subunit beta (sulfur reductase)